MSAATSREPSPMSAAGAHIWDLVIADVRLRSGTMFGEVHPVYDALVADMRARDKMGAERYGTHLQADNGRDPMVDGYQEALDYAVYMRQAVERGYPVRDLYTQALNAVVRHKEAMMLAL